MLYQQTLDANGVLQLAIPGKLFLLDSIGVAASVRVTLTRSNAQVFDADGMTRGLRIFTANGYDSIRIVGAAGAVMRFIVGVEDVQISTIDGSAVSVPGGVEVTNTVLNPVPINAIGATFTAANVGLVSADTFTGVADVSALAGVATQIAAADAVNTEREIIIKNLNANTATMRIAGATAAAAIGHELAPGESITLNTMAAVYAFNPGAGAESLSVIINSRA